MKKAGFFTAILSLVLVSSGAIAFADTSSSTSATTCPQGWTWNGSNCQVNQQSCTAAGGTWSNSTASCSFGSSVSGSSGTSGSSGPNMPAPTSGGQTGSCPADTYPYNGTCISAWQACTQSGNGVWNGTSCQPKSPTTTQTTAPPQPTPQTTTPTHTQPVGLAASLSKIQARLHKVGLLLPSDCTTNGMQCRVEGSELLQASLVMKNLQTAHDRLTKSKPLSDASTADWNMLLSDYATLKSGTFTVFDLYDFFDDARVVADEFGLDANTIPSISSAMSFEAPAPQTQSLSASVFESLGSFFLKLIP